MSGTQRSVVDVFLLLTRGDEVLLGLRQGTGFADGMWNLPSGKAEHDEMAVTAMIREAREEIGVVLGPDQLSFAAVVQCRNSATDVRVQPLTSSHSRSRPWSPNRSWYACIDVHAGGTSAYRSAVR
jgi:8-oxo-dGTP pyrophosphatase MutT (NUDIX family)